MVRFFNTLGRKKQIFKPLDEGKVRLYSCGLTVYDSPHIGNLRAYVFVDLLRRWLEYRGFDVNHVMNITDVDDKTIRGSTEEGIPLTAYTQRYIEMFYKDLQLLNIQKAKILPKATDHIPDMVQLVTELMDKGYGYRGEDGSIYFDISKFKGYGKLSRMKLEELKAGARVKVDEYGKEQASDFALWKAWDPSDGDVFWETRLGKGRPGWHIECSAMAMKYLGETLDIHTGGVDLVFPHHENEIAQSEAATNKQFVKYWLHNEHLLIEGARMAKSLGNIYTLRDMVRMGHDPLAVRYLLLSTHYRTQLNFTFEGLEAAKNALQRLYDFLDRLERVEGEHGRAEELANKTRRAFEEALDDDLDINNALAAVFGLVREVNTLIDEEKLSGEEAEQIRNLMRDFDRILGVLEGYWKRKLEKLPEEIEALIRKREEARQAEDWNTADAIRSKLREMGIILEDTSEGVVWKRVSS